MKCFKRIEKQLISFLCLYLFYLLKIFESCFFPDELTQGFKKVYNLKI